MKSTCGKLIETGPIIVFFFNYCKSKSLKLICKLRIMFCCLCLLVVQHDDAGVGTQRTASFPDNTI